MPAMAEDSLSAADLARSTHTRPIYHTYTLGDQDLAWKCPLAHLQAGSPPAQDLGRLDKLPLELLTAVVLEVPLKDLIRFTLLNRRGLEVVNSIPEWKAVSKHGLGLVRGLLATNIAAHVTLPDLHGALCTSKCAHCGDVGGYIYLFTCTRVCYLCFASTEIGQKALYYPLTVPEAARQFGVPRKLIAALPSMNSLPGRYSAQNNRRTSKSYALVDFGTARQAAVQHHGSQEKMTDKVSALQTADKNAWEEKMEAWRRAGDWNSGLKRPRSYLTRDIYNSDPGGLRKYVAIMPAPYMNTTGTTADWRFHCLGCKYHDSYPDRTSKHFMRKFDIETFQEHLKECGRIEGGGHVLG